MTETTHNHNKSRLFQLTTDGWAVASALALALLVRLGLIHRVPW